MGDKPLGHKNYGSIPHLPGSRRGPSDRGCNEQQAALAIGPKRKSKRHTVVVQEKLDGSNVGVARIKDILIPLGRAGWPAITSKWEQHRLFHNWAMERHDDFMSVLKNGERIVGEWLAQAHGTRYDLGDKDPFVAIDIMREHVRMPYDQFRERVFGVFYRPPIVYTGPYCSIEKAMALIGYTGWYGALDDVEGAVWRVEYNKPTGVKGQSKMTVLFLTKYVRPDKEDGKYLPEMSGEDVVWNWRPG